jgi:hypothetical protein
MSLSVSASRGRLHLYRIPRTLLCPPAIGRAHAARSCCGGAIFNVMCTTVACLTCPRFVWSSNCASQLTTGRCIVHPPLRGLSLVLVAGSSSSFGGFMDSDGDGRASHLPKSSVLYVAKDGSRIEPPKTAMGRAQMSASKSSRMLPRLEGGNAGAKAMTWSGHG